MSDPNRIPPGQTLWEKFLPLTTSQEFANASPAERINMILSVKTPQDVRFLSKFMEEEVSLQSFTQTSPTSASAVFKFTVSRFYCNGSGNLHGGAQSTMYDMLTSLSIQAIGRKDFWMNGGVSRSLNVTYLRPAPEGTEVTCQVEIMSAGKGMALLRGIMKMGREGKLISTCDHDKAAVKVKAGYDPGTTGVGGSKL